MTAELELQRTILATLRGDAGLTALVTAVYDYVPQVEDAGDPAEFPYVTIGEDNLTAWDTDTTTGADVTVTIHTWSRTKGRKETKTIQGAIYTALNRATLTIAGFSFVTCDLLGSESFRDTDGITVHGVQTFRVLFNTA